jgi:hypothetical protein
VNSECREFAGIKANSRRQKARRKETIKYQTKNVENIILKNPLRKPHALSLVCTLSVYHSPFTIDHSLFTIHRGISGTDAIPIFTVRSGIQLARNLNTDRKLFTGVSASLEAASKKIAVANIILTGTGALINGKWKWHNTIDFATSIASYACPLFGLVWFLGDIVSEAVSQKTLSENIEEQIDYY